MPDPVRVVHLVAKTHLDLGFTDLAVEVVDRYRRDFFPRAVAVAEALRARGGVERLVWTTGSWILHDALAAEARSAGAGGAVAPVARAVAAGDLAWHALPVTTHTELLDAGLARAGLGISAELDVRFGCTTVAAKLTDVPGHTRALVPLLAEAGVTFLHIGVNPAWPVPDVAPVFRWRSPDGAEVTVAYQAGGYGGDVAVEGCDEVLAFLHSGDNLGPPSVDDVLAAHADLRSRYPGADVRASTLDGFARALAASGAVSALPVVTAEIGDPWLFGAGSDPQKVAAYRALLRDRRSLPAPSTEVDRALLLVAEHTWGLDQKTWLPDDVAWDRAALAGLRATPEGRRFESSWAEQRAYVDAAARRVAEAWHREGGGPDPAATPIRPERLVTVAGRQAAGADAVRALDASLGSADGWVELSAGERIEVGGWSFGLDAATGAVGHLVVRDSGRVLADADHPLGLVTYQAFDEADYARFYAGLSPTPEDEGWARWDNTKPGIDAAGARSGTWPTELVGAWQRRHPTAGWHEVAVRAAFRGAPADRLGAPAEVWSHWSWRGADRIAVTVGWVDKPANRLPEALWCSFVPRVAEPARWSVDKLGQAVSPLDVVRRGGRSLHAVGEGMAYDGPDGALRIATPDAPLVAPGRPNLLDADPPVPDLAGGFHVLLLDNCWGTNFPMWNEGAARFAFALAAG